MSMTLQDALVDAHIPSLLVTLAQLTGDGAYLSKPAVYEILGDGQGGFSTEERQRIRAEAARVLPPFLDGRRVPSEKLAAEDVRRMMNFLAGVPIPDRYAPFLTEELGLDGVDGRSPDWSLAELGSSPRRLRVLVIGAGMSGLLAAIRLKQAGIEFVVVEKNADVGGTWYENSYPGCRVDSPNHLYSYSFEPNHDWPQYFSTRDVLLAYFRRVADKHGLRSFIRFQTTVVEARFDETRALWRVRTRADDGRTEEIEADAVISAVGQLNQPLLPAIPGRDDFAGVAFHSAQWRHDVDLTDKHVAVIGTGASAFQLIPEIARQAARLTIFQRSAPWLGPTPEYHHDVPPGKMFLLQHVPLYEKWYRFWLFWIWTDGMYDAVKVDPQWSGPPTSVSAMNEALGAALAAKIREQVTDRPDLEAAVIPTYPLGGKRALRDNGVWIEALKRPNTRLVATPISRITPGGIETTDAIAHPCDVIIYGTGFRASDFLCTLRVVGRNGVQLREHWKGDARAYLGITVPAFPNFFMLYGPNTNIVVNGSIIFMAECSMRYVMGCLKLLAERDAATLEVRAAIHDAFNRKVDAANALMAWGMPAASNWYKNATGRVSQNWPFPLVDYWAATLAPHPADFLVTSRGEQLSSSTSAATPVHDGLMDRFDDRTFPS